MISLTTDFDDFYVGQIKGIIYKINPEAKIIDITHKIRRQSIYEALYVISNSYRYFPKNTVHIVVVDPGVGSNRDPIMIEQKDHIFIGPDNGIFSLMEGDIYKIMTDVLFNKLLKYGIQNISNTFHGRDIFAPAAALLDKGERDFLEEKSHKVILDLKRDIKKDSISASVLFVDIFGNVILNIKKEDINTDQIELSNIKLPILNNYEEGKSHELIALFSSSGHLEISKYLGSANSTLNVKAGDTLLIKFR
ncbi:MAG: Chlorinase [Candidatus Methanofastidiosum methylothiophilum]|uniref:Chlorinase n=1 Tax=Candidatus Methanofastidiosum methylothiophilum TaxID=1705564 RepID=A0A150J7M2_9EURY|nr:MAG: Chlorinase [Candidatus Methanofastidiosum methylthiophilus]